MIAYVLLDLDPNVVKPGWTPAIITLGLAIAIALLYLSMRNQVRRINVPYADGEAAPGSETDLDATAADGPAPVAGRNGEQAPGADPATQSSSHPAG